MQPRDELIIEGLRADLLKIKDIDGLDFKGDVHLADPDADPQELTIVEGVLLPRSPLIGHNLRSLGFKERYGLQVLALHRAGRVPTTISSARLRLGDVLLLQGTRADVKTLERGNLFNIFGGVETARLNFARAPLATAIFVLAIAAVTFNLPSLPVAALAGAFLMLVTRCLSPEQAYVQVEWKALILIGALLSLGAAMEASGTGRYLAPAHRAHRRRALWPADLFLCPDRRAHAAHVQSGRRFGRAADRLADWPGARRQSPRLRHDGGRGGQLFLSDASRALLPDGLWARQV